MFDLIPFRKSAYFHQFINSFFDENFVNSTNFLGNNFNVDLKETDTEYILQATLPGIKKEAIELTYNNNYLIISAQKNDIVENKNDNFIKRERKYGRLSRSFYLDNVNKENIKASFNDGVLTIKLPKENKSLSNFEKIYIE
ncbi:Hsp20/alpha crystallin family protein [Clostridium rectalis]|uniref:Hsp20/alpha crystallin family protein n=1 Tax=Clostridium rectalis TaxID=2040295 RepID=UPI000F635F0A|nr:Hsp20/alpha crystallin family protein [Clostridium rectalis]